MISELRAMGATLANHTDGGEGTADRKPRSDEYKESVRVKVMGANNPNYHNFWNDEQKERLSKVRKEKGIAKGGKNPRARRVMCVETGMVFLCQQDASDWLGLKSMASINHALKEKRYVASGYHFVSGDDIDRLNTPEKRKQYLLELQSK